MDTQNIQNMNLELLQMFVKWVRSMTTSQLNNLDYIKFAEFAHISSESAQQHFQNLCGNGYIYLKVITRCPNCGCECAIDTETSDDSFECCNCCESFNWKCRLDLSNFSYKANMSVIRLDDTKRISSPLEMISTIGIQRKTKVIEIGEKIREKKKIGEEASLMAGKAKVFIVHGHDEATARRVKEFIKDDLNMEAIILMDEVSVGLTIPEKFEQHANECNYAVILMTPDDKLKYDGKDEVVYRARQNVILELGYFWARFDRKKFAVIKKGNIETPSDIQGVVYLEFSNTVEETFYKLQKEIKAALGI